MSDNYGPLSALARRLLSLGPPSLSILIARLGEVEEYEDFINLVKEFLPEYEAEILYKPTPAGQMATFANRFGDRYFPINDNIGQWEEESYYELTRGIPIIIRGISWDDYDYITTDCRPGIQLMTYLVEDPYNDDGGHAPLAEACAEHVPVDLLQMVPVGGLPLDEVHRTFDNTPYKALAIWGDMVGMSTGNAFLDYDWEMMGGQVPPWDREAIELLTRDWQQADLLSQEVDDLAEWLEGDLATRFKELLDFILQRREEVKNETSHERDIGETPPAPGDGEDPDTRKDLCS